MIAATAGAPRPLAPLPPVANQGSTGRRRGRFHRYYNGRGCVRLVAVLGFLSCGLPYVVYHMHTLAMNGHHGGGGFAAEFADFSSAIPDPAGGRDDVETFEGAATEAEASKLERFTRLRDFEANNNHTTLFPPFIYRTTSNLDEIGWEASRRIRDCEELNPSYEHVMFDDVTMRDFVRSNYPEFAKAFDMLPEPVMRADMWRYLVLHRRGGVYMDMDVECRRPIDEWCDVFLNPVKAGGGGGGLGGLDGNTSSPSHNRLLVNALIGIEFCEGAFGYVQFVQWAMASRRPGHPIFYRAVEMIRDIVTNSTSDADGAGGDNWLENINPEFVTGPVVFTAAVLEFLVRGGFLSLDQVVGGRRQVGEDVERRNHLDNSTRRLRDCDADVLLGDLGILNKQAFGYHFMHPGSPPVDSPRIYLRHWFDGSWRPKPNVSSSGESMDW